MGDSDELLRALAGLRVTNPRVEWAQSVRERCHERLARAACKAEPKPRRIGALDAAALAALWIYLACMLEFATHLIAMRAPLG